jgi:hypothetical protein
MALAWWLVPCLPVPPGKHGFKYISQFREREWNIKNIMINGWQMPKAQMTHECGAGKKIYLMPLDSKVSIIQWEKW